MRTEGEGRVNEVPARHGVPACHVSSEHRSDGSGEGKNNFRGGNASSPSLRGVGMLQSVFWGTRGAGQGASIGGLHSNQRASSRAVVGMPPSLEAAAMKDLRSRKTMSRSLSVGSRCAGKLLCFAAFILVISLLGTSEAGYPRKDRMRGYLDAGTALYEYWEGGPGGKGLTGDDAESFCAGRGGNLARVDSEDVHQIVAGLTGGDHSKVRIRSRTMQAKHATALNSAARSFPQPVFSGRGEVVKGTHRTWL